MNPLLLVLLLLFVTNRTPLSTLVGPSLTPHSSQIRGNSLNGVAPRAQTRTLGNLLLDPTLLFLLPLIITLFPNG